MSSPPTETKQLAFDAVSAWDGVDPIELALLLTEHLGLPFEVERGGSHTKSKPPAPKRGKAGPATTGPEEL